MAVASPFGPRLLMLLLLRSCPSHVEYGLASRVAGSNSTANDYDPDLNLKALGTSYSITVCAPPPPKPWPAHLSAPSLLPLLLAMLGVFCLYGPFAKDQSMRASNLLTLLAFIDQKM